jgi:diacylglycerol kinase (ATP)
MNPFVFVHQVVLVRARLSEAMVVGKANSMEHGATLDDPRSGSSFTFTGRLRSMRFAMRGIRTMLASQHNAWVHAGSTAVVIATGFILRVDRSDWCMLILAMMAVWTAEALNTAFEFLCDVASPEFHPMVAKSKDVAAGAVLLSAIGAAAVGLLVFVPHLTRIF